MGIDLEQELKEKYFLKAEELIQEAGFEDLLKVKREAFAMLYGKVKVYFQPIPRKKRNILRWKLAKQAIDELKEIKAMGYRDECGNRHESIFIHAYILLEMEQEDSFV